MRAAACSKQRRCTGRAAGEAAYAERVALHEGPGCEGAACCGPTPPEPSGKLRLPEQEHWLRHAHPHSRRT